MQTAMSIVTKLLYKIDKGSGNEIEKILNGCLCVCGCCLRTKVFLKDNHTLIKVNKILNVYQPYSDRGEGGGGGSLIRLHCVALHFTTSKTYKNSR